MMPQVIMMREIHRRAPTRTSSRLLGTSNSEYPMKNTPAPSPNAAALKPRSRFICSAASPTFDRSRKLKM